LLEAWKFFSEKFEDTKLIIIGSGSLENELKQQIATQNLEDSVIMTGACYNQDLWAWYYLADFLILPSIFEPFGAVVNEALTGGIPCLVSIKAGSRVLIKSDKQGYLIDPDSIEDIREKMTKIYLSYSGRNKNEQPESLMPWNLHSFVDRFIKFCKLSYN
jgi:glycosyltransferase involved in cell wall biosynthesis